MFIRLTAKVAENCNADSNATGTICILNPLFKCVPRDFQRLTVAKFIQELPNLFENADYAQKCIMTKYIMEAYDKLINDTIERYAPNVRRCKKTNTGVSLHENNGDITSVCLRNTSKCLIDLIGTHQKSMKNTRNPEPVPISDKTVPDLQDTPMSSLSARRKGFNVPTLQSFDFDKKISFREIERFVENENNRQRLGHFSGASKYLLRNIRRDESPLSLTLQVQTRPTPAQISLTDDPIDQYCAQYPLLPEPSLSTSYSPVVPLQSRLEGLVLSEADYMKRFPLNEMKIIKVPTADLNHSKQQGTLHLFSSSFVNISMDLSLIQDEIDRVSVNTFQIVDMTTPRPASVSSGSQTLSDLRLRKQIHSRSAAFHSAGSSSGQLQMPKNIDISGNRGSDSLELAPIASSSGLRYTGT